MSRPLLVVLALSATLGLSACARKDAALVIGGFEDSLDPSDDVELYGCDNNVDYVIELADFPRLVIILVIEMRMMLSSVEFL